jgi:hypothetical protein
MLWRGDDPESYRLEEGRDDTISLRIYLWDPPRKNRDDRSTFHTIIYLTRVLISSMLVSGRVDATSIFDVEVSALLSGSLHELSRIRIEDIIHSAAESITPITHGQSRLRRHVKNIEEMETLILRIILL